MLIWLLQPLHKATLNGDWENAERFFIAFPGSYMARALNQKGMTILHVAANMGHADFIRELLRSRFFSKEALTTKDKNGFIALHYAASFGNLSAIKSLVSADFTTTQIQDFDGLIPLCTAINNTASKQVIWYLAVKTISNDHDSGPFSGVNGTKLIISLVHAGHYDICLYLFNKYPDLANHSVSHWKEISYYDLLLTLVRRQSEFPSGNKLSFWKRCICRIIYIEPPVSRKSYMGDSHREYTMMAKLVIQGIPKAASKCLSYIVPGFKHCRDEKYKHKFIMDLLDTTCKTMSKWDVNDILAYFKVNKVHFEAAENGGIEIIRALIEHFPVIMDDTEVDCAILIMAVQYRQVDIYNIMMERGITVKFLPDYVDEKTEDNLLHIAARLAPYVRLSSVACPALQMQRELQWFKEVEKFVPHFMKVAKNKMENKDRLIPRELFTTEHKELVRDAEKWMKETANSCLVVATLILTVVFAAAFTIPGGNIDGTGIPLLLRRNEFVIFVVSDVVGMFSSATSILMFLSILTARYAEEDFLIAIPTRLIFGLSFLLIAIASMMVTFGVAVYMILNPRFNWVIFPIVGLTCIPVGMFVMLQLPLFIYMVRSTYGHILKPMKSSTR